MIWKEGRECVSIMDEHPYILSAPPCKPQFMDPYFKFERVLRNQK
jgi:hypothetical protein